MSISLLTIVPLLIVIAIVIWYMTANQQNETKETRHPLLSPDQYQNNYAKREHLLVDVRSPEEFTSGHIQGAVNIALPDLPTKMAMLPKDRPIILYCRSGARSSAGVSMLARHGFTDIHDLGGLIAWQAQGLPVS